MTRYEEEKVTTTYEGVDEPRDERVDNLNMNATRSKLDKTISASFTATTFVYDSEGASAPEDEEANQ